MAKKKNNGELDKAKKFYDDIKDKRKNVPGFDSFYKLVLWMIFIFVVLLLVAIYGRTPIKIVSTQPTTLPANTYSYKELLNKRMEAGTNYIVNVEYNGTKVRYEATIKEDKITGIVEDNVNTGKFTIKEGNYYSVKLDEETLVNDLIYNVGVLDVINLIKTLQNNQSLKTVDNNIVNYKYDITINNIAYEINTKVENKVVSTIMVKNENSSYEIVFK